MPLMTADDPPLLCVSPRILFGEQARFFDDEIKPSLKHTKRGLVGMASGGKNLNASQVGRLTCCDINTHRWMVKMS